MQLPNLKVKLVEEFRAFLLTHGVIGLAVAVVIGGAVGKLVKAIVDDLIMPIVGVFTPSGDWRQVTWGIGNLQFGVGDLAGNLIDFSIVAFVVFLIIKRLVREPAQAPAPQIKTCPACLESVLAAARKCKFCGSDLTV